MTIAPSTLPRSAAAICDDDGRELATIYATAAGVEIVAAPGATLDCTIEFRAGADRVGVQITRTKEARHK